LADIAHDEARRLMEAAFANLLDPNEPVSALSRFYAADCLQEVDGERMDYAQFLDHARQIRASTRSAKVRFEALATEGLAIAAIYTVASVSQKGEAANLEVFAFLTVADGKIASLKELTRVMREDAGASAPPASALPRSGGSALGREEAAALLNGAFACLLDPREDAGNLDRYFSPSYVQDVDGEHMDYTHFLDHARTLKALVVDSSTIADIHLIEAEKADGGRLSTKVFAFFFVEDGRIGRVRELTRLVRGDAADRDLGSRRSDA
jgi:ketosteroid isomerase-like protein